MSIEILTWNILSGGFKDYGSKEQMPSRIDGLATIVKELEPDIVCFIDTYRWTEIFSISDLKHMFNYPKIHVVKLDDKRLITKGHDNGIAVFSKNNNAKISTIRLVTRNAIKTHLAGIDIFTIYFDDLSEDTRIKQTQAVLDLVNPNVPTIITGDFNTFDTDDLNETLVNLNELKQTYPNLMKDIETPIREMKRGEVTQLLKKNEFIDLGKDAGCTFPAKLFPFSIEKPLLRIDYAFGNNKTRLEDFKVLTNDIVGILSDHYPIWMKISNV